MFNKGNTFSRGPVNNRFFNTRANNAQSYLNKVKAMRMSGSSSMTAGRRMQFNIPGMVASPYPKMSGMNRARMNAYRM